MLLPEALALNFKIIILLLFVVSCGVKSNPVAPKDSSYPSYYSKFAPVKKATPAAKETPTDTE